MSNSLISWTGHLPPQLLAREYAVNDAEHCLPDGSQSIRKLWPASDPRPSRYKKSNLVHGRDRSQVDRDPLLCSSAGSVLTLHGILERSPQLCRFSLEACRCFYGPVNSVQRMLQLLREGVGQARRSRHHHGPSAHTSDADIMGRPYARDFE